MSPVFLSNKTATWSVIPIGTILSSRAKTPFATPAIAVQSQARLDNIVPIGMTLQAAVLFDKNTGDIWYYNLDKPTEDGYAGTIEALGKPLTRRAAAPVARAQETRVDAYIVAGRTADLRN